jgi:hypothetical protein
MTEKEPQESSLEVNLLGDAQSRQKRMEEILSDMETQIFLPGVSVENNGTVTNKSEDRLRFDPKLKPVGNGSIKPALN